jgi:maltodextrin utilization protein YvdJ
MWFFASLIPATIWVVLGYFILFSSTKSEGAVQKFGQILAVWVFVIAALLPVMGGYATLSGFSLEAMMKPMHESMHPAEGSEETRPVPNM